MQYCLGGDRRRTVQYYHFHFEDEKKQIIYTMLINLIILKINEKINSDEKKFKMVYYSAKSQMDSKYIVCIELSH